MKHAAPQGIKAKRTKTPQAKNCGSCSFFSPLDFEMWREANGVLLRHVFVFFALFRGP